MNTPEMKEHLKTLLNGYIAHIEEVKSNIQIEFIGSYDFTTCDSKNKAKIEKIGKKDFIIYVIKTKAKLTQKQAEEGYDTLQADGFGTFRVNNEKDDNHFYFQKDSPEKYLYVGSSQDIRKRLKEHLGVENKKGEIIAKTTYALHLAKWWEKKKITVDLYEVTTNEEDMQLYEDLLWEEYKPLLGKKGRK